MKIAPIGYGKMGKMIEEVALSRGHQVPLKIGLSNLDDFTEANLKTVDVAIEFTGPATAFSNVQRCLDFGLPVICGSTGWNERMEEARDYCRKKGGAFLHASNFSIGVNIFFQVNELLARLMATQPTYEVSLREVHHTQKKDAPSGTAVTLAEGILQQMDRKKEWVNAAAAAPDQIAIISERVDPAPGTHYVTYSSEIDDIQIIHTAHNRKGFAAGAVLAAEYIVGKKGVFQMKDVLGI